MEISKKEFIESIWRTCRGLNEKKKWDYDQSPEKIRAINLEVWGATGRASKNIGVGLRQSQFETSSNTRKAWYSLI